MSRLQTVEEARGRWPGILESLGIDPCYLKNIHGPCPICKNGKDRWRFDDQLNGRWFCSHCGSGDGFQLLQLFHSWDFKKAADEVDRVLGTGIPKSDVKPAETDEKKRANLRGIMAGALRVIQGDPVWRYLENRCQCDPTPYLGDIRFHPKLKHMDGDYFPAMLAPMGWDGTRFHGVHRTWITEDGHKANVRQAKASYGDMGAIRLGPSMEAMGIAEGIETAICAAQRFGLPVWSGVCAEGLKKWNPPSGVSRVLIFGDNDASFTGQEASFSLAKRLAKSGLEVEVHIPDAKGTDWADYAQEMKVA